ncbi:MAG: TIGR00730 family Rossman fold protein [Clostridia bacterium]|nr:TIGR00730 family Rossman fold protein [Deltaproteobacteria bacterium]
MKVFDKICVFTGSSIGAREDFKLAARSLGQRLVQENIGLVYGGGSIGLMGAIADAVIEERGRVFGVIPQMLATREVVHPSLTELTVVSSMHARKQTMADMADAFIAMPGGFGTFDELFEVLTWAQLGVHRKPIGLLNVAGYFDGLVSMVEHAIAEGFVPKSHRDLFVISTSPSVLLAQMRAHESPVLHACL